MKRLLAFVLLPVALVSCKEDRFCWSCDYTYTGSQASLSGDTVLCNFTETDIELRQDISFVANDTLYDTWMITDCRKQ